MVEITGVLLVAALLIAFRDWFLGAIILGVIAALLAIVWEGLSERNWTPLLIAGWFGLLFFVLPTWLKNRSRRGESQSSVLNTNGPDGGNE